MDFKVNVRFQLKHARRMTEGVLREFKTRGEMLAQPHLDANNAIWVAGHLALADNYMMSHIRPEIDHKPEAIDARYWFGSKPTHVDANNATTEEVLAYMADRRKVLWKIFDEITEREWKTPVPSGTSFSNFPNLGHIFLFNTMHEGIHLGQLTVAHRALGKPPLKRPKSASA